jgi:hypothetical protein
MEAEWQASCTHIQTRNHAGFPLVIFWETSAGTVAAIVVAERVIKGQTMHLSAMASVLCLAAKVHPPDSRAASARSAAYRPSKP